MLLIVTTYGNAYLITFEVGPLRAHTLAPSLLTLLEAAVEGFFRNLSELSRRIRFDVIHGCKTCALDNITVVSQPPDLAPSDF